MYRVHTRRQFAISAGQVEMRHPTLLRVEIVENTGVKKLLPSKQNNIELSLQLAKVEL